MELTIGRGEFMTMEERIEIRGDDVFALTDKGDEELKRGSTELSIPRSSCWCC